MEPQTPPDNNTDNVQYYIDQINDLKNNTVSRSEYEKVQKDNRDLFTALKNRQLVEESSNTETPKVPLSELRENFFNPDRTNLDYVKTALELHDRTLAETGINDFVPNSHMNSVTEEDLAAAGQVEEFLRSLVETANGDPNVFNIEYQRRVVDTVPMFRRK